MTGPPLLLLLLSLFGKTLGDLSSPPLKCGHGAGAKKPRRSFLWRLHRGGNDSPPPVHLFGTIHVPYDRVWHSISPKVKEAFGQADNVVFELDLSEPRTLQALQACKQLPDGKSLGEFLPPNLFHRIKAVMRRFQSEQQRRRNESTPPITSPVGSWEGLGPIWVLLLLNSLGGINSSSSTPSLDEFLAQAAHYAEQHVGAIEDPLEQCRPLNAIPKEQVVEALEESLGRLEASAELSSGDSQTADLVHHYNCGSLSAEVFERDSRQQVTSSLKSPIDAFLQRELIRKRNGRMAARVAASLQNFPNSSFFFAFGAGHFVGADNVVELLRAGGFQLEEVVREDFEETVPASLSLIPLLRQSSSYVHPPRLFHKRRVGRKPRFRDLWVRLDDYQERSWQEIEAEQFSSSSAVAVPLQLPFSSLSSMVIFSFLLLFCHL